MDIIREDFAFDDITKEINESLKKNENTKGGWVCLLYWLQRKHGSLDPMLTKTENEVTGVYQRLSVTSYSEKEHLIPFSHLTNVYNNLQQRDRNKSHLVNSIGNLLFISRDLNHREPANCPLKFDSTIPLKSYGMDKNWVLNFEKLTSDIQENGIIYKKLQELENTKGNEKTKKERRKKLRNEISQLYTEWKNRDFTFTYDNNQDVNSVTSKCSGGSALEKSIEHLFLKRREIIAINSQIG